MEFGVILFSMTLFVSFLAAVRAVSILGRVCARTNHKIRVALWLIAVSAFSTFAQTVWTRDAPVESLVAVLFSLCLILYLDRRNVRSYFNGEHHARRSTDHS
jgi:hypothetical protein